MPGGNTSGASNNSNLAYLDSSNSGIRNNSVGLNSGGLNVGSSGGSGSSGNDKI